MTTDSAKSATRAGDGDGIARPLSTVDVSKTQPQDFEGEVSTNDELPSKETIAKIENYPVLDRDGHSRPFGKLYRGAGTTRRTLFIFIRHFYCGVSLLNMNAWCLRMAHGSRQPFGTGKPEQRNE